jgi:hypothetical protein
MFGGHLIEAAQCRPGARGRKHESYWNWLVVSLNSVISAWLELFSRGLLWLVGWRSAAVIDRDTGLPVTEEVWRCDELRAEGLSQREIIGASQRAYSSRCLLSVLVPNSCVRHEWQIQKF